MPKLKSKDKVLQPVRPNAGVEALYRKRLQALIDEMHRSVLYWVMAAYRSNPPKMAQDELPANMLRMVIRRLSKRWQKRFADAAPKLAQYYATSADNRSKTELKRILFEAGFSVDFRFTQELRDALKAVIHENVSLIKSIPQQYFTNIEGAVMRSVAKGGDDATLGKTLHEQYGVTKRRAAIISRDQNTKAMAVCVRTRQTEVGITEAIWTHSFGGNHPRPTHYKNNGSKYEIAKGWYDPDAHGKGKGARVYPGELINCRCVSRSVVPGFN